MSYKVIRERIQTLLESVDGIGRIYTFRRHITTWEKVFSELTKNGKVNVWEITRTASAQDLEDVGAAIAVEPVYKDVHTINILGYLALNDANKTEETFQDLIDRIIEKIRLNSTLGGGVVLLPKSLQAPLIDYKMFGDTLVHFATLTFEAVERVGQGSSGG